MRRTAVRKLHTILLTILLSLAASAGAEESAVENLDPASAPETSEVIPLPPQGKISGKVTQTMDVAEYTYIEVDTGNGLVWAAGPVTNVKVGDTVETSSGIEMVNFQSSALGRTFDRIRLVSVIQVWSPNSGSSKSAADVGSAAEEVSVSGIERVEGGHTVAEVIAGKANLAGSEIAVRGKITKMNTGIMGRNWLHLSDGTVGPAGEKDLTVTTEEVPAIGSTVVVRGTVATDRDFGSGYQYSILIENAKVTIE
jgi:hypothetical protein